MGTVVASRKVVGLEGVKLLLVEPVDDTGTVRGPWHVAVDATGQAGPSDLVTCVSAREASLALDEPFVPVDAAIISIVDQVTRSA